MGNKSLTREEKELTYTRFREFLYLVINNRFEEEINEKRSNDPTEIIDRCSITGFYESIQTIFNIPYPILQRITETISDIEKGGVVINDELWIRGHVYGIWSIIRQKKRNKRIINRMFR